MFSMSYTKCRTCLKKLDAQEVYIRLGEKELGMEINLRKKLMLCIPEMTLAGDCTDEVICMNCSNMLNIAYMFRTICLNAEKELKKQNYSAVAPRSGPLTLVSNVKIEPTNDLRLGNLLLSSPSVDTIHNLRLPRVEMEEDELELSSSSYSSSSVRRGRANAQRQSPLLEVMAEAEMDNDEYFHRNAAASRKRKRSKLGSSEDESEESASDSVENNALLLKNCQQLGLRPEDLRCFVSLTLPTYVNWHKPTPRSMNGQPCPICGKKYKTGGKMTVHLLRHFNCKLFTCPLCKRGFYERYLLNNHLEAHRISDNKKTSTDNTAKKFNVMPKLHKELTSSSTSINPSSSTISQRSRKTVNYAEDDDIYTSGTETPPPNNSKFRNVAMKSTTHMPVKQVTAIRTKAKLTNGKPPNPTVTIRRTGNQYTVKKAALAAGKLVTSTPKKQPTIQEAFARQGSSVNKSPGTSKSIKVEKKSPGGVKLEEKPLAATKFAKDNGLVPLGSGKSSLKGRGLKAKVISITGKKMVGIHARKAIFSEKPKQVAKKRIRVKVAKEFPKVQSVPEVPVIDGHLRYECILCEVLLSNADVLRAHLHKYHCNICYTFDISVTRLRSHRLLHLPQTIGNETFLYCLVCESYFLRDHFYDHLENSSGGIMLRAKLAQIFRKDPLPTFDSTDSSAIARLKSKVSCDRANCGFFSTSTLVTEMHTNVVHHKAKGSKTTKAARRKKEQETVKEEEEEIVEEEELVEGTETAPELDLSNEERLDTSTDTNGIQCNVCYQWCGEAEQHVCPVIQMYKCQVCFMSFDRLSLIEHVKVHLAGPT